MLMLKMLRIENAYEFFRDDKYYIIFNHMTKLI